MKKAYEYFSNKHLKNQNQPTDRKHHAGSIDIHQLKNKDSQPMPSKKEIKEPSVIMSQQVSGQSSLKNSKNAKPSTNNQNSQYSYLLQEAQKNHNANHGKVINLQSQQLDGEEFVKMNRVKSYGNLSSKASAQQKLHQQQLLNGQVPSKQIIGNYFHINQNNSTNINQNISASVINPHDLYKQEKLSREDATTLLLHYSSNLQNKSFEPESIISSQRDSSPKFLQINLKMFNNYLTSNNPQNINTSNQFQPSGNRFNVLDQKIYEDENNNSIQMNIQNQQQQITPQIMQLIQQHQQSINAKSSSKERLRKARDPINNKITQDDDTLKMISQVSKKSIEIQQQLEKNKVNLTLDFINQLNSNSSIQVKNNQKVSTKNIHKINYEDSGATFQNNFSQSSLNTNVQTASQTIQQSSGEKKRPASEIGSSLYNRCQNNIQNNKNQQKLKPLYVEKPLNGFSNITQQNSMANLNRLGSYSSCSLLQVGANAVNSQSIILDDSNIQDEVSPTKKNHVTVLVSMLDEKNKYIKQLHKKIDKLNDIIANYQQNNTVNYHDSIKRTASYNKSRFKQSSNQKDPYQNSPSLSKSRSQQNIQRAKSSLQISNQPSNSRMKQKLIVSQMRSQDNNLMNVSIHELNEVSVNSNKLVKQMDININKALENLESMKQQNLIIFRELFLNEPSSTGDDTSVELSRDVSQNRLESYYQSNAIEECNYISVGGNANASQDDSYQDYLNNADLDPLEDVKKEISEDKKRIIKSTSNFKTKKSASNSKCASVRAGSQKATARGAGSQSQLNNHSVPQINPAQSTQKNQKQQNNSQLKVQSSNNTNLQQHNRPPTSSAVQTKPKKIAVSSLNIAKQKKIPQQSISSACDNYQLNSNFQSITTIREIDKTPQSSQSVSVNNLHQQQFLVDQLNQYKAQVKVKDKKLDKHKEFINKLKQQLENVLVEHKKQAEQLESQKKELRALKCKLSLH
ncbi:UNKNOWN [Stylonychia lemnae]|uniref:Uncharacterized protein n=1 Tax=Stylonychia lemnae TaxID=5949 RepID=A0A078A6T9_STYLE|nr:UNKNOWN [Stylonychia lemnae]|eukprot:CDW77939.1 UNKNOWN [Stylonychia lemnae]